MDVGTSTRRARARRARAALLLAALLVGSGPARADSVVVVVDTSSSMRTNDPDRLAVLSVLVLADLVDPATDELLVVPFDRRLAGADATASGPVAIRRAFPHTAAFRDELLRIVTQDATSTYFAPPIAHALDALEALPHRTGRTVLLVLTDGASSDERADLGRLEQQILPRLRQDDVTAWFVSLGGAASGQPAIAQFFASSRVGGHLDAPTATDLPGVLAEAFARSTGRVAEAVSAGSKRPYTLEAGGPLAEVQIAAVGRGVVDAGSLAVTDPTRHAWSGGPGDDVLGLVASTDGRTVHGYRRLRLVAPAPGRWTVAPATPLSLVVLRRHHFEVDLAVRGGTSVPATTRGCFTARVLSRANPQATAVPVTQAAVLHGLDVRLLLSETGAAAAARAPLVLADDGVAPSDDVAGDGTFGGCLVPRETDAGVGLVAVAELSERGNVYATSSPLGLDVLPALRLRPSPAALVLGGAGLATGERACATFALTPPTAVLPTDPTPLEVALGEPDASGHWLPGGHEPLAASVRLTLDGAPLTADGTPLSVAWSPTQATHEVCAVPGKRPSGGTAKLLLRLAAHDPAYAAAGIDDQLGVDVQLLEPGLLERWGLALATTALLGVAAAAALWMRQPLALPEGLRVTVWSSDPDRPPHAPTDDVREAVQDLGLDVRVRGERIVVSGRGLQRRDASGVWREVGITQDGALEVAAGVTYRSGERYLRFGWGAP